MATVTATGAGSGRTMRAMVQDGYGPPEVLRVADVPVPVPADDAVLVRVVASSVNALDWHMLRGTPVVVRLTDGFRRPKAGIRGVDVAGVVEAVGRDVTWAKPGDEVFGARDGAFAEYVAGRIFAPKPAQVSFEEAASIPIAGFTALQAVRDHGGVRPGHRVLVTGAGGGVGSLAVQIARAHGAHVTAETGGDRVALVGTLGADRVVDRGVEDVTRAADRFDAVIDVAGRASLTALGRLLAPGGVLVVVGAAGNGRGLGTLLLPAAAVVRSRFGSRRMVPFMARSNRDDLLVLAGLAASGALRPVIDRTYPLERAGEAIGYVESGHARGKVVVTI
jgi:NADPH:quinone reductase-like Zn-dependent oxidoreductase